MKLSIRLRSFLMILSAASVVSLSQTAAVAAVNLSLSATVTANSEYLPAGNVIDGNDGTYWVANDHGYPTDPNWLVIDLGSAQSVGQIRGFWQQPDGEYAGYTTVYNFYTGVTGSDWVLRSSGTFIDESPNLSDRLFTLDYSGGLLMRYAKYEVVGGSHWSGMAEIGIFSDNDPSVIPEPATMLLLGSGIVGLAFRAKKRQQRHNA